MMKKTILLVLVIAFQLPCFSQDITFTYQSGLSSPIKRMLSVRGSNVLLAAARDGSVIAWNTENNKILVRLESSHEELTDMVYADSERKLIISGDKGIDVYDASRLLTEHQLSYQYSDKNAPISAMHWNEASGMLHVASRSGDIVTFSAINDINNHRVTDSFQSAVNNPAAIKQIGQNMCVIGMHDQAFYSLLEKKVLFRGKHYNTGLYGFAFNDGDSSVYLPEEASTIKLSYKRNRFSVTRYRIGSGQEGELALGIAAHPAKDIVYGSNNAGRIVQLLKNGATKRIFQHETSFTSLFVYNDLLYAGDFFGNIITIDPGTNRAITQLNEDPTPSVNGVYVNGNTLVSTHFGSRGVAIKIWDIPLATLQQSFNLPCNIAHNVIFRGEDSIISIHSDKAVFLYRRAGNLFVLDTLQKPAIPFQPGSIIFNYEQDARMQREENAQYLRELFGNSGVIPLLTTNSEPYELTYVNNLTVPGECREGKLPRNYRIPEAYLAAAGLVKESKNWDILDQDLFYGKACTSDDFPEFVSRVSSYNIDSVKAHTFFRLVKGEDVMPSFFYIAEKTDTTHHMLDVLYFKEKPRYIDFVKMPQKLLFFFTDSVVVWDAHTSMFRSLHVNVGDFGFNYDFDSTHLVFADELTNTIILYNLTGKAKLGAKMISYGVDDFLAYIPGGYYRTKGKSNRVNVNVKGEPVSFNSFDIIFNRPDKVLEYIGLADTSLITAFRKAVMKRLRQYGIDNEVVYAAGDIPEAGIVNKQAISYHQQGLLQLHIMGKGRSVPLKRFNVWVNDVPLFGSHGQSLNNLPYTFDTTLNIELSSGDNRVEVAFTSAGQLQSTRQAINVYSTKQASSRLYFVGIGIDKYRDSSYNLRYSVQDIKKLAGMLVSRYGSAIIIDTLFNANVTPGKVAALKERLLQTTVDDKVIISYSGHGLLDSGYNYFLSAYHMNFDSPREQGIPYEQVEDLLDRIPARKKLMLIDACHSGEIDKEEISRIEKIKPGSDTSGTNKSTIRIKSRLGMINSFQLMQNLFLNINRGTGATVISAAGGLQYAQERNALQNGVFTYSIIDAFRKNKTLTISQLRSIVSESVIRLSNGQQQPTSRNESGTYDWVVW